jgi:hypothetical protein
MKKDNKYKWKQHMLYASESNDLAKAEKEWIHPYNSYVPDGQDNCLCSARITNKYKIVNAKNGHVAFVGLTCLKKIVPKGTRKSLNKVKYTGPPVEYDDLDIEAYLRHCAMICGSLDLQMAQEQLERERLERLERERLELLELERLEQLQLERQECLELERQEQLELERERLERERLERERLELLERERLERERLARLERKRLARLERKRLEQLERERLEREQLERERLESFQSRRLAYSALKSRQLTFLEYEAKRSIKKNGEPTPTKAYLQSYMEQMRAGLSNHEWALVLSNRKRTTYETEKTKIDLLFPH